ncbi:uncharacterized protein EDB93DRAFT_1182859 [Suillus bovinus]|uniref:uncharacterized protein n=1 Tax=Suillus bovinus TaxID=48563 RepID=UPI001B86CA2B|nr:uncharacterized protein EDB93DRAFT_1182859 [Suillus bovinus]KAG2129218.1 hypothetical protein EDB93DRAFT_1182859 [Suillus bovinus]
MLPVRPQNVSSSSKAPGGQAIKEEENTERTVGLFTRSSSESDTKTVDVHVEHQIHAQDIARFAQSGYNEHVKQLATRSGFQATIVQNVYKHVSSFKRTEKVIKAMHTAALECAKEEIIEEELDAEDLIHHMYLVSQRQICNRNFRETEQTI